MASPDYDTEDTKSSDGEGASGDLFRKLKRWYCESLPHVNEWRNGTKDDYQDGGAKQDWDFYNNRQYNDTDLQKLRTKNRPALVFNQIKSVVDAVVGAEVNNRREVRYFPREQGDALANDLLTSGAEWFRDESGAEDQESDAFKSQLVCGMGWTDTRIDFEMNPDGDPCIEYIDEFEMVWDHSSTKANLSDTEYRFRVREMGLKDAMELTGVKDQNKYGANWPKSGEFDNPHDQQESNLYTGTQSEDEHKPSKKVTVVEARWLEKETYFRGPDVTWQPDPMGAPDQQPPVKEYAKEQVDAFKAQTGMDLPVVKQTRKVLKRAFLSREILGKIDKPMVPPGTGLFGWECITGYKDKNENQWYGLVRTAKNPQEFANKFLSQTMFLMNVKAKGGVMAERGAFESDRDAQASWAKADEITWLKPGALSGDKPMIAPKAESPFPAGFFTMYQESKESVNDVLGISKEFIGTREAEQAGVLEYQRRQSSLNLLAELFNALRRYRKRQGRVMLYLIQERLADGRLVRIVGDEKSQYVPLTKEAVADKEYDIIIDDSPNSPNEKERTWQIIQPLLPLIPPEMMQDPAFQIELLEMSPLPASKMEKLKQMLSEKAQQPPPPSPEEMKAQAQIQAVQQKGAVDLQVAEQKGQIEIMSKLAELKMQQDKNQMELEQTRQEMELKYQEAIMQFGLKAQEHQQNQVISHNKMQNDMDKISIQEKANDVQRKAVAAKATQSASAKGT